MKKLILPLTVLISIAFGMQSCDMFGSLSTISVDLGEKAIEIPLEVTLTRAAAEADGFYQFSGAQEISLQDDAFSQLDQYLNGYNIKLTASDVYAVVALAAGVTDGTMLRNISSTLKDEANETVATFSVEEIDITENFSSEGITTYLREVLAAIESGDRYIISFKGETDIKAVSPSNGNLGTLSLISKMKAKVKANSDKVEE